MVKVMDLAILKTIQVKAIKIYIDFRLNYHSSLITELSFNY